MEYRKLISFGKSSFIVSLPKQWITKQKLNKGDLVYLDEKGGDLILSPREKEIKPEEKECTIDIDGKSIRRIQREIISSYIKNHKKIFLLGDEIKDKAKDIQDFMQKLIALEIVSQDSKKITAQDFLNIDDINVDQVIRKMDVITRSMLEDCKTMFEEDIYENIYFRDNDVNKFHYLIFRIVWLGMENPSIVFKKFDLAQKDLLSLWWLAYSLEKIADCIKRIARHMREIKLDARNKQKFKDILARIGENYTGMMKGYYTKDPEIAHEILQKREELIEQCDDFFFKNRNIPFTGYLIYNTKSFLINVHNIGRIIYQGIPG